MKGVKDQKGFSLIEMVLYISISMIVMLGVTYFYLSLVSNNVKTEVAESVQTQTYAILEKIEKDLLSADDISSPTQGNSSDLVIEVSGDQILYSLNDGKIIRQVNVAESEELNSSNVWISSITFINSSATDTPDTITISIASNGSSTSLRNEFHYNYQAQTTLTLRK